jgi:gamma-glutamyltranspeptidase/glutathione hydrolase/leukotriene-C4 hydrolase
MAEVFLKPGTMDPLLEGDTCRNTRLAATLRRVADEGAGILREGPLAESLAQDIRDAGGIVTAADLAQYRPRIMAPLRAQAMGFTLLGMPPPSSGGAAVAQVLEFLGGYARPLSSPGTLGTHRLAEAFKNAFAMRMNLGDPEAALPNLAAALADMLSPSFNAELRAATLDNATRPATAYGARWNQLDDSGRRAGICFIFCPNSLCLISQMQPIMLELCPIMPNFMPKIPGTCRAFSICLLCQK